MAEDNNLRRQLIIAGIVFLLAVLLVILAAEADLIRRVIWGVEEEVTFQGQNIGRRFRSEVKRIVKNASLDITSYPVGATIDSQTGEVNPEFFGKIVALTETVDKIMEAEEETKVSPVVYEIKPYLTASDIEQLTKILDSYTTVITGEEARRDNIKLAANLINNQLVLSGEVFSFNEVVGPRTKKRGFKEAPEFSEGELTSGVGGGICQVSSTLYNALDLEKLEVIERHSHSRGVSYVPEGKDATIAGDYFDFRFKNELATPIIVKAEIESRKLTVFILGPREEKPIRK
jgi:vancomycin resistance protein VanW